MKLLKNIQFIFSVLWIFRYYAIAAIVALLFWDSAFIKPFRVFVVLVHEINHALMALATGGEVIEIRTFWDESGHALTRGGIVALICSAGYVGSATWGALMIYSNSFIRLQRLLLMLVGITCTIMSLIYGSIGTLDFFFGMGVGILITVVALISTKCARICSIWIGTMLCLYSLHDFSTDLFYIPEQTDAGILAMHYGFSKEYAYLPAYPIAFIWVVMSLWAMYRAMRGLVRNECAPRT